MEVDEKQPLPEAQPPDAKLDEPLNPGDDAKQEAPNVPPLPPDVPVRPNAPDQPPAPPVDPPPPDVPGFFNEIVRHLAVVFDDAMKRLWFGWVQRGVNLGVVTISEDRMKAFPGLRPPAPEAKLQVAEAMRLLTPDGKDIGGEVADTPSAFVWDAPSRSFLPASADDRRRWFLNTRVWCRAEFDVWCDMAVYNHAFLDERKQTLEKRAEYLTKLTERPTDLHLLRALAVKGEVDNVDPMTAVAMGLRFDHEWSHECMRMLACAASIRDPRPLVILWAFLQSIEDHDVSPVFGLMQGIIAHAPVTENLNAFKLLLSRVPTGARIEPKLADDSMKLLYFDPTHINLDQVITGDAAVPGRDNTQNVKDHIQRCVEEKALDPDLYFQRVFAYVAPQISLSERNAHSWDPHGEGHIVTPRTYALARTQALRNQLIDKLAATHSNDVEHWRCYDIAADFTFWVAIGTKNDDRRVHKPTEAPWLASLFVVVKNRNRAGGSPWIDVFGMVYGDNLPFDLRLEEDYDSSWEFPALIENYLRVTNTYVFRSYVANCYEVWGPNLVRGDREMRNVETKYVAIEHVQRSMPLLVLPWVG